MGSSRWIAARAAVTLALLVAPAVAAPLVLGGCDSLLGLGSYAVVDCAFDCGAPAAALPSSSDAANDAGPAPDAPPPVPQVWASWPMPNPDAAIAAGADASLPNQMAYATSALADDAGSVAVAHDLVTKLVWEVDGTTPATSPGFASAHCAALAARFGGAWRVPARIELASLIDFTQPSSTPTIDPTTFSAAPGPYWTSSVVPSDAGPGAPSSWWTVDFSTGLVENSRAGAYVRCVSGPS